MEFQKMSRNVGLKDAPMTGALLFRVCLLFFLLRSLALF